MELPIGMIRLDELIRILRALQSTGGCDERTLQIVAQAVGVDDYLKPLPVVVVVENNKRLPG